MLTAALSVVLAFGAIGVLVLGVRFALADAEKRDGHSEAIFAFVACFFLLLGLRVMFLGGSDPGGFLLGDLLASLALTFFWMMRRKAGNRSNGHEPD